MPTLSLNASKKTKHTPAGEIPVDWAAVVLSDVIENLESGVSVSGEDRPANDSESGVLKVSAVSKGRFFPNENKAILPADLKRARMRPRIGAILVSRSNTPDLVGESARVPADYPNLFLPDKLWQVCIRPETQTDEGWLSYVLQFPDVRRLISERASGTSKSMRNISKPSFLSIPIPLPPLPEQIRIAAILSTWDRAIETLESLIAAKDRRKQALMQQLLTGRKRLPGFDQSDGLTKRDRFERYPADWEALRLGQITTETGKRNSRGGEHPVLSCTKHHGLVLSEEYFGRRVHAEDTSNYRLVHRGEFAYATNHIEEGSIGYQDLCETGLVSPIYTVFKSNGRVSPNYLFRVLKSPLFLHLYQVNTSASVDRRGSLRYKEFSQLPIWLPSRSEQDAITSVFDTTDRELTLHRQHLATLRTQKRGLMQKLLTGQVRVAP
jgi:type I restriction enzyme S subunit